MVFLTGLPASGKSFLLRELVTIATAAGRDVEIIRWDIGLAAFQKDWVLAKYPDGRDGDHPVVRKAAGLWGRQAIARWLTEHSDSQKMLIGEVPIIGNRYSEFVEVLPDQAEPALASDTTAFFYPIPTRDVRLRLEALREATFTNPQHPHEARDATPATMDMAWRLTRSKALQLDLISPGDIDEHGGYEETVYRRFFDYLLQHRNSWALDVDMIYSGGGSAHDLDAAVTELLASPDEVTTAIAAVEAAMSAAEAARAVEDWYRV